MKSRPSIIPPRNNGHASSCPGAFLDWLSGALMLPRSVSEQLTALSVWVQNAEHTPGGTTGSIGAALYGAVRGWAMMEIHLLQAAVAVAEHLSFTRAAIELDISQSALTKQIKVLEARVGCELFRRTHQFVEVTESGEEFVQHARQALLLIEKAVHLARARSAGAEIILRFGKSPYTDPFLVSSLLAVRLPLFPKMKVNLSSNFSGALVHQVLAGSLDIAVVSGIADTPGLSTVRIASAPLYVAMETSDPLARLQEVRLSDLANRDWILFERHVNQQFYDRFQRIVAEDKVTPSDIQHVTSAEEASPLIVGHHGLAFLTRMGAWRINRDGITMRPLADDRLQLTTCLAARADEKSRLVSEFLRASVRKLQNVSRPEQRSLPLAV